MDTLEFIIDDLREKKKWEDVKKQHKQYTKLIKAQKAFKSIYTTNEERIAYAETVKADYSISKRGKDGSAWKHIQGALDACPTFPDAIVLATIIHLSRTRYPKNNNLFNEMKETITYNVIKNINKLKAQTMNAKITPEDAMEPLHVITMYLTCSSSVNPVPDDTEEIRDVEDEDASEDDVDDVNVEYSVQRTGWRVILSLNLKTLQVGVEKMTPYTVVLTVVALALGFDMMQQCEADQQDEVAGMLLETMWDLLVQYNARIAHASSPLCVFDHLQHFDHTSVFTALSQLPQYHLRQVSTAAAVTTYRLLIREAGKYPRNPFPKVEYLNLLLQFAKLLVYVLRDSPCYDPVKSDDEVQTPETALEEALLLLLLLQKEFDSIGSVEKKLEICKLAFHAYIFSGLFADGVHYLETAVQDLGHSSLLWYLIADAYYRDHNFVLCLQSLQNCLDNIHRAPFSLYHIAEYGTDEANSTLVNKYMALLFSAKVCIGHLHRIDDCLHFCALVLQDASCKIYVVQALLLTGLGQIALARQMPFYSEREQYLGEAVAYLTKAKEYSSENNLYVIYNLALALAERNKTVPALQLLQDLVNANPFFPLSWTLLTLLTYRHSGYTAARGILDQAFCTCGNQLELKLLRCKMENCEHSGQMTAPLVISLYEALVRTVQDALGDQEEENEEADVITVNASSSLLLESLLFACQFYTCNSLTAESEKVLGILDSSFADSLYARVRTCVERSRLFFLLERVEDAEKALQQAKLYMPQLMETQMLEASVLLSQASNDMVTVKSLREDKDMRMDELLLQEHICTKRLLAAEQVLRGVLQRDQRLATAWAMWGRVLELLGCNDKACEVMLTAMEWDKANGFESVSTCDVVL